MKTPSIKIFELKYNILSVSTIWIIAEQTDTLRKQISTIWVKTKYGENYNKPQDWPDGCTILVSSNNDLLIPIMHNCDEDCYAG